MSSEPAILGRTLGGRFRVVGFIGEGAMASVFRGVQEAEPHDVALKIMHPHLVNDATFVGRFRREARAASSIEHPNTVKIVDTGVDGKLLYIAMELLGGQDLFETMVLERRLAEARAVRILVQVTDALVAAHEKGVVHRDLKPENIMLLRDDADPSREDVKVLDFGIAKILEIESPSGDGPPSMASALTGVGTVVGTPAYMSPEQCRGDPVDTRCDIYACGVLLYQLVCGRLPFSSPNAMDVAVMHVRTPPTPPQEIVPAVSRELEAIILKALSKWPAQRQQSAAELRDALRAVLPSLSPLPLELAVPAPAPATTAPVAPAAALSKDAPTLPPGPLLPKKSSEPAAAPVPEPPKAKLPTGPQTPGPAGHAETPGPAGASGPGRASSPGVQKPVAKGETPRPVPNPASAALKPRTSGELTPTKGGVLASWLVVPLALLVGVAMGALAFFLSRR